MTIKRSTVRGLLSIVLLSQSRKTNGRKIVSQPVKEQIRIVRKKNFKRMQREVRKEVYEVGIGTKAQQAMKLQTELNKKEHQLKSREQQEQEKAIKFQMKQEKKKKKHRGH